MEKELFETNSEDETIALGAKFAARLKDGDVVSLYGDLGAGKTGFIKGVCEFFDVDEMITSPTFTIINQYYGSHGGEDQLIYHIDLYRMKSESELNSIGFPELIQSSDGIKLIEWAEKSFGTIPGSGYSVRIGTDAALENKRHIEIETLDSIIKG